MFNCGVDAIPVKSRIDLEPLRRFVRDVAMPASRHCDASGEFPTDVYRELYRQGWFYAFLPERYGGAGATLADMIWIARELAYGAPGIFTSLAANTVALLPYVQAASEDLRARVLCSVTEGFSLSSFCWSEPSSGNDIYNIRTQAERVHGGYRLTGAKCFITNAGLAERFTVVARTAGADGTTGRRKAFSLFHVPARVQGVSIGKPLQKMGQNDSNTSEVFFDQVFVPESDRIGHEGDGVSVSFRALQRSKTLIAAACVGICHRASDLLRAHLGARRVYGKPLLEQPTIQSLLAKLHCEVQAAWLLTCQSAAECDRGGDAVKEASMAKLFATETAVRFVSEAVELFGGYGYTREFEIEKLYRDVRLYEIIEGPSLVQQALLARELFPELTEKKDRTQAELPLRPAA